MSSSIPRKKRKYFKTWGAFPIHPSQQQASTWLDVQCHKSQSWHLGEHKQVTQKDKAKCRILAAFHDSEDVAGNLTLSYTFCGSKCLPPSISWLVAKFQAVWKWWSYHMDHFHVFRGKLFEQKYHLQFLTFLREKTSSDFPPFLQTKTWTEKYLETTSIHSLKLR